MNVNPPPPNDDWSHPHPNLPAAPTSPWTEDGFEPSTAGSGRSRGLELTHRLLATIVVSFLGLATLMAVLGYVMPATVVGFVGLIGIGLLPWLSWRSWSILRSRAWGGVPTWGWVSMALFTAVLVMAAGFKPTDDVAESQALVTVDYGRDLAAMDLEDSTSSSGVRANPGEIYPAFAHSEQNDHEAELGIVTAYDGFNVTATGFQTNQLSPELVDIDISVHLYNREGSRDVRSSDWRLFDQAGNAVPLSEEDESFELDRGEGRSMQLHTAARSSISALYVVHDPPSSDTARGVWLINLDGSPAQSIANFTAPPSLPADTAPLLAADPTTTPRVVSATAVPPTAVAATPVPPTPVPATPTPIPPTAVPPTPVPPTPVPPTPVPPTPVPPTPVPPTPVPPTPVPPTPVPPTPAPPPTAAPQPSQSCTPGYSPCIPPGPDVDCAGGSGNGPRYVGRVQVTGSDPYGLDRDNDGVGCE